MQPPAAGPGGAELALLGPFVEPAFRARLARLLAGPRGRAKLVSRLGALPPPRPSPRRGRPAGRPHGGRRRGLAWWPGASQRCYVVPQDPELDGRTLPLRAALVSCVPGKLAYFEGEEAARAVLDHARAVALGVPG